MEFCLASFYLTSDDLTKSFNTGYEKEWLSISQRRGIISLMPKDMMMLS